MNNLHESVVTLAHWRERTADAQAKVKAMMDALMDSPEYKAAAQESLEAHQMMCESEDAVREIAVRTYEEFGEKSPHDAVVVKLFTELEYDEGVALDYCREHLHAALRLDTKTFEKAAKVIPLDFVTTVEVPKATIARDLSEWL